jgi:hypothetical protein
MKQKWKKIYSSNDKIVWLNSINNEIKICYFTDEDGKTPLPKGWKRWFSNTRRLFYYTYNDNNGHKQIKWKSPSEFNQHDYSPEEEKEESRTIDLYLEDDVKRTFNLDLEDDLKDEPRTIDLDLEDVKRTFNLDLEDDLEDVKRIYDTADGNINLKWHGNTIPCILENVDDITSIQIIGNPYEKPLVINGYKSQQTRNICLDFVFLKDKKIAYIELLSIFSNNCPGPENGKGTFFLDLVDEICKRLGIKTLQLDDQSIITSKEGVEVGLEFLSLMKYGLSWYERHGFVYKNQRRKDILIQTGKTPISKIKKHLTDKFPEIGNKVNFDKIYNTLRIIAEYEKNEENPDSLSGFLTYVWNKNNSNNFREYKDSLSVLYPPREYEYNIPEDILPAFPTTIHPTMIKEVSMQASLSQ